MRKAPIALLILAAAGVLLVASGSLRAQTPNPNRRRTSFSSNGGK